jgi:hypothetical protein
MTLYQSRRLLALVLLLQYNALVQQSRLYPTSLWARSDGAILLEREGAEPPMFLSEVRI